MKPISESQSDHAGTIAPIIGQLGHKLGPHLMAAEGYCSILQNRIPDTGREYEYLEKIRQQIVMMGEIKEKMMEIARPAASRKH